MRKNKIFTHVAAMLTSHVFLLLLCFTMVLPFTWMVLTSLKPFVEAGNLEWTPKDWSPENYPNVFKALKYDAMTYEQAGKLHWHWWQYFTDSAFFRYYFNSLFVAGWVTLLQTLTSAMAAFAFSRLKWKGRDKVFLLYLATMMVPGLVLMIPNYQIMIGLGLRTQHN